jgi:hypothetical protein
MLSVGARLACILGAAAACVGAALAAENGTGTIRIVPDPRPEWRIFVDGKPAQVRDGKLTVPAGWREVQVEVIDGRRVTACRRLLQVPADATVSALLMLEPVVTPSAWRWMPGVGPPGPPGPRGDPATGALLEADDERLAAELRTALLTVLHDSERTLHTRRRFLICPTTYTYSPPGLEKPPPVPDVPGTLPWPGPRGPAGLRGDLGLVRDNGGIPVRDILPRRLGLVDAEEEAAAVFERTRLLPRIPTTISIHGPDARELLAEHERLLREKGLAAQGFVPAPSPGPAGPRGPLGAPLPEGAELRLTPERLERIVEAVLNDPEVQRRAEGLRFLVRDTRLWLDEARRREAH